MDVLHPEGREAKGHDPDAHWPEEVEHVQAHRCQMQHERPESVMRKQPVVGVLELVLKDVAELVKKFDTDADGDVDYEAYKVDFMFPAVSEQSDGSLRKSNAIKNTINQLRDIWRWLHFYNY